MLYSAPVLMGVIMRVMCFVADGVIYTGLSALFFETVYKFVENAAVHISVTAIKLPLMLISLWPTH